jgi:hypothetical protein
MRQSSFSAHFHTTKNLRDIDRGSTIDNVAVGLEGPVVSHIEHARVTGPKASIFISYSRKDMEFADRLEAALQARGYQPLIDRSEIYAFEDWWKRIEALISRADTVVFVLSPDAVASDVALKEVAFAAALNKRFAPIVCRCVEDSVVPDPLRRLNFILFDDPDRFEGSADRLAEALQTDISWIRQHTEYGEAERRWSSAGRPNGLLLQSPTLDLAEYWLVSRPRGAPRANGRNPIVCACKPQTGACVESTLAIDDGGYIHVYGRHYPWPHRMDQSGVP